MAIKKSPFTGEQYLSAARDQISENPQGQLKSPSSVSADNSMQATSFIQVLISSPGSCHSSMILAAWIILESHLTAKNTITYDVVPESSTTKTSTGLSEENVLQMENIDGNVVLDVFMSKIQETFTGISEVIFRGLQDLMEKKVTATTKFPPRMKVILESPASSEQPAGTYHHARTGKQKFFTQSPGRSKVSTRDIPFRSNTVQDPRLLASLNAHPLVLLCENIEGKIVTTIAFDTKYLDYPYVKRLTTQLNAVMDQIVQKDEETRLRISDINLMTQDDQEDIWKWNCVLPDAVERCVHDLISEQAVSNPKSPAISAWDGDFTYGELDMISSSLSTELANQGICHGSIVPLCFEKSCWTAIAILAVMKAGSAFVLLDVEQPEERLKEIIRQISKNGTPTIVTSEAQTQLAKRLASKLIVVGNTTKTQAEVEMQSVRKNKNILVRPDDNLYVVFTSGTTGRPKGVVISHCNFSTAVKYQAVSLGMTADSRVFDFAGYAFDVSINNCLMTLATGGCLCIPSPWERKNDLTAAIVRSRVTVAELTPAVARLISPEAIPSLRFLNLSGEGVAAADIQPWVSLLTPAASEFTAVCDSSVPVPPPGSGSRLRVINSYGPAECTITCVINPSIESPLDATIIGKAVGAVSWITDPKDPTRLAPVGAIGELLIEGPLVGSGYLNLPDQTAQNFIEAPLWLSQPPNGLFTGRKNRLYRTGDLVRYRTNGSIEYIGRKDSQSKLRGQRFEPAEVEHHLLQHLPRGTQVVVDVIEPKTGAKSQLLVAFVVFKRREQQPEKIAFAERLTEIEMKLRGSLPSFMVPAAYIPLEKIPTTASGKVDRQRLKILGSCTAVDEMITAYSKLSTKLPKVVPSDTKGLKLRSLWAEVLHIDQDQIGLDEHFFAVGGESIAAIRLVGAARKQGLTLTVADIFRNPLLKDMSGVCVQIHSEIEEPIAPFSLLNEETRDRVLSEAANLCKLDLSAIEDVYPATPLQQGLMALGEQRTAAYVGRQTLLLPSCVHVARFKAAWEQVYAANETLRTIIVDTESGGILQVVANNPKIQWLESNSLSEYLEKDHLKQMGFATSLCRFAIIRESASVHYFVLTLHHALYDGWTLPRIGQEVLKAYKGEPNAPRIGFNNFIKYIINQASDQIQDYWKSQLSDSHNTTFFPQLPSISYRPRGDSICVREFTLAHKTPISISLPSVIRGAWSILCAKLSTNHDVTFGATVSGRNVPVCGVEEILSPTISTIPFRVKVDWDQSVQDFLVNIQRQSVDMMPFENYGLQNIHSIGPQYRNACAFQTLLIVQPPDFELLVEPNEYVDVRELRKMLQSLDVSKELTDFNDYALMLIITQADGRLLVEASYDSQVLEEIQVQRILAQLEHVLRQLTQNDVFAKKVAQISCTSPEDLDTIWEWNAQVPQSLDECVHTQISTRAARQPKAQAICAWDGALSYGELDELSSRLAIHLQDQGVRRGVNVPLCFEKSLWTTVAMLGMAKAGGTFVAMDVGQPVQRLQTIARQVDADIILSSKTKAHLASQLTSRTIIVGSDSEWGSLAADQIYLSTTVKSPDALFVVFTSGSTGIPKGIVITHKNFYTAAMYHGRKLGMNEQSRVFDFASYSFDIAMDNALTTLILGGCLCVPSEHDRSNDIEGAISRMQATLANITPSVARIIDPSAVPTLQHLVLAGERIPKDVVVQWGSRVQLYNAYGPAECQICTASTQLTEPENATNIGRGLGSVTWIVDPETSELASIGATGELYVEGPIVSPGYLNNPEQTAAGWVNDPRWLLKGSTLITGRHGRLYRTGDLTKYNQDGTITYIGRANSQVKVNGQRIELEEVEHHLRQYSTAVKEIVADVIQVGNSTRLVAFLLSKSRSDEGAGITDEFAMELIPPPQGLNAKLGLVLPRHVIPSLYFSISHIPQTASNKTHRNFLRERATLISPLNQSPSNEDESIQALLTAEQEKMRSIWSQILKIPRARIQAESNFFLEGGDSISAMSLVRAGRKGGISFTVKDIFQQQTLRKMVETADFSTNSPQTDDDASLQSPAPFSLMPKNIDKFNLRSVAGSCCELDPALIEDIYPCSPLQEGLMSQTAKTPKAYIYQSVYNIPAEVDITKFQDAWNVVVDNNTILRTRIAQVEPYGFVQVVLKKGIEWCTFDTLSDYLARDAQLPMRIGGDLCRWAISAATRKKDRKFVWTLHHSIYDAWSLDTVSNQLAKVYYGELLGQTTNYHAFIKHIANQECHSMTYWQTQLVGATGAAVFPSQQSRFGGSQPKHQLTKMLPKPPAQLPGLTLAITIRAAWAILAARITGSDSVLFGTTLLGRHVSVPGIENIVGPTTATVPIMVNASSEQPLSTLLFEIRQQSLDMQPHEHYGLHNIAKLNEDTLAACAFQTLLVLQSRAEDHSSNNVRPIQILDVSKEDENLEAFNSYPLMLDFNQDNDAICVQANFDPNVIEQCMVEHVLDQFQKIFAQLCKPNLSRTVGDLDFADQEDVDKIWQWNADVPEASNHSIHDLFTAQVERTPDSTAISSWDGEFTYRELENYASVLAQRILQTGIQANSIVPLCFEKSRWTVVAMIAILKTGSAFTAMDPNLPSARLEKIVEAAGSTVIISSTSHAATARSLASTVLEINKTSFSLSDRTFSDRSTVFKNSPPNSTLSPENIMYLSFTSGSSGGVPKGVAISHRNFASAVKHQASLLGFNSSARVYDFASYSFDSNLADTFFTLLTGGCVCIPSESDRIERLAETMKQMRVNLADLTPQLARTINPSQVPEIKTLHLGGEAVTATDVFTWADQTHLINTYGPTEATPMSVINFSIKSTFDAAIIGRGIGAVTWIVDPDNYNQLRAIGAVGELVLEGPLVGQGYHKDPIKTAKSFIKNPDWLAKASTATPSRRNGILYRTGDLVRYTLDGSIEYVGRADTQVKLRGQRIEMGEIEYHLKQIIPQEVNVVVEVIESSGGSQMLVAFMTPMHLDQFAITSQMASKLPSYMIPVAFLTIDVIPLSSAGKTNRNLLKALGPKLVDAQLIDTKLKLQQDHKPLSSMETRLRNLWSKILLKECDIIGESSNFFREGGDSIQAMRLSGIARDDGISLAVSTIFQNPTLSAMASHATPLAQSSDNILPFSLLHSKNYAKTLEEISTQCNISSDLIQDAYSCTPLQEGLMLLSLKQPTAYISRSVAQIPSDIDMERLEAAFNTVTRLNVILRTRIVHTSHGFLQVVLKDQHQSVFSMSATQNLDDVAKMTVGFGDPLTRWTLINTNEAPKLLLWEIHHALYDAVSYSSFLAQVTQLYNGNILEPKLGFNHFIRHLQLQNAKDSEDFWKSELSGAQTTSRFPVLPAEDYVPLPTQTAEYRLRAVLPAKSGTTLQANIQAGWAILISKITGDESVIFGSTLTGRNAHVSGIEKMTGPTLTTVPRRVDISDRSQATDTFVLEVQQQIGDMIPFEHTGLQIISKFDQNTKAACRFQTLILVYANEDRDRGIRDNDVVTFEELDTDHVSADFNTYALNLLFSPDSDGITLEAHFDPNVIGKVEVRRLARQLERILQQLFSKEHLPQLIDDIDCLSEQDMCDIWKLNSDVPDPIDETCLQSFARSIKERPNSPAIMAHDLCMTYRQLEEASSKLSCLLFERGVRRGVVVPILFEKSGWMPVVMLAVWKTGGAVLGLDINQPENRLRSIMKQISATIVLTTEKSHNLGASLVEKALLISHRLFDRITTDVMMQCSETPQPSDLCYLVFTSGSTGTPKGVMISHANMAAAFKYQTGLTGFDSHTRSLEFSSYNFDNSVSTIALTFAAGGCVCVPTEDERQNDLEGAINRMSVNLLVLTPSVASLINPTNIPGVKTLNLAGEAVNMRSFEKFFPDIKVNNLYGPSECTAYSVGNVTVEGCDDSSIGVGVGAVTWIVDQGNYDRLVPIGAIGELLLEGPLVGMGYYNDAPKTSEMFKTDISWLKHGANGQRGRSTTLYRTGDLVKYQTNGNIEYIGRRDTQVKIRGQRIELGEVEIKIQQHLAHEFHVAVEVIAPSQSTAQLLVAFLSISYARGEPTCSEPSQDWIARLLDLNHHLVENLPRYMVPSRYVVVSHIPLNINGKTDRKQLKTLGIAASIDLQFIPSTLDDKSYQQPSTKDEHIMQRLWAEVLGVEPNTIGANDNFFAHNGDSIAAMRLVGLARQAGIALSVANVFSNARLSDMARNLRKTNSSVVEEIPRFALLNGILTSERIQQLAADACGTPKNLIDDVYPCSPLQESMMAATLRRSSAYVSRNIFSLPLDVDISRFCGAWNSVQQAYPILRTRIVQLKDVGSVQVIVGESIEWESSATMEEFFALAEKSKFGLGSRLSSWAIIGSGKERQFSWIVHHSLYDGFTLPIILKEVEQAYMCQGSLNSYVDFKPFLRHLQLQSLESTEKFWQSEFLDAENIVLFPTLPNKSYEPRAQDVFHHVFELAPTWRQTGLTLQSVFHAAWAILTSRITGNSDVVFGAIRSGRNAAVEDIDRLLAPTITTVPVRINAEKSQYQFTFMDTVQKNTIKVMPFEHSGIHNIRRFSKACEAACNFQSVLLIQPPTTSVATAEDDDQMKSDLMQNNETGNEFFHFNDYSLFLEIVPVGTEVSVHVSYDKNVVGSQQMERLMYQFETVVQQLGVVNVNCKGTLEDINSVSKHDLNNIWAWNGPCPVAVNDNLLNMLADIFREQPNAPAIDAWDGQFSYAQLETYSANLAKSLVRQGFKKGWFVPILFEKSKWTSLSMLAVMKTGAAFVPLDASHPEGRLRAIMQQLDVKAILCSARFADLGSRLAKRSIVIDEANLDLSTMASKNDVSSELQPHPSDIAYAVFTSGSTGKPKGVLITHQNLCTAAKSQASFLGFSKTTRSLDFASYSFDACVFNLFYTLAEGGCLCVPSDSDRQSGNVGSLINKMKVNLAQLTPSICRTFSPKSVNNLERLILTGERLTPGDVSSWQGTVTIVNVYGPTECTIMCTGNTNVTTPSKSSNVGRGLGANTWICEPGNLDRLAPIGSVGELLIEGPLIGAGYINQPEMTSQSLVTDPVWLLKGNNSHYGRTGQLFRTGDLVQYDSDGSIIYVGRQEMEIKLRGQRIDLADVEQNVRPHLPEEATVTAEIITPDGSSEILVCFVTFPNESYSPASLSEMVPGLHSKLGDDLPGYLKPSAYIQIQKTPMTPSGKTDRRALKLMGSSLSRDQMIDATGHQDAGKRRPQTPSEHKLASLWASALHLPLEAIGADDNFFRTGGDSIRAMQLITMAETEGIALTMAELFANPELSAIARVLDLAADCNPIQRVLYKPFSLLKDVNDVQSFIRTHIQPRIDVPLKEIVDVYPANGFQIDCLNSKTELFGLQYAYLDIDPHVEVDRIYGAFLKVMQASEALRGRFVDLDGSYFQVILRDAPLITTEYVTQDDLATFSNRFCLEDPTTAKLSDFFTTFTLVKAPKDRRRIIFRLSHTQNDGFCVSQIFKAFEDAYHERELDPSPPFSAVLHHRSQRAEAAREYWRMVLAGSVMTPTPVFEAGTGIDILRTQLLSIPGLMNDVRFRPQVILNAAWALVLAKLSGRSDVIFGNVVAGRSSGPPEVHQVVGPCVNMLPMRFKTDQLSLTEMLDHTASLLNSSSLHEGLDWHDIVNTCTDWAPGTKQGSAVHFRNMEFEPNIDLGTGSEVTDVKSDVKVGWYELVARPEWTGLLAHPEGDELRLWIFADPAGLSVEKADEILDMVKHQIRELLATRKQVSIGK